MSKVAVVYWSGTGNTGNDGTKSCRGRERAGAEVMIFTAAEFQADR